MVLQCLGIIFLLILYFRRRRVFDHCDLHALPRAHLALVLLVSIQCNVY